MSKIDHGTEAEAYACTMDIDLPNSTRTRSCLDLNCLVREEAERVLKENNLSTEPAVTYVKEPNGTVILLQEDRPLLEYRAKLAQGASILLIKRS